MKLRTIAVVGGLGLAGLALVGAGASATFTQNTSSSQKITAGTMNVTLAAPDASGNNTQNITLKDVGPVGSTFETDTLVTITNNGNIPVSEINLQLGDTNNNGTLQSEAWVCFYSDNELLVNEPLTTVEGYGSAAVGGSIAVGGTDTYTLVVYAGSADNGCGGAFTGFTGGSYTTNETPASPPAFGTNPSSPALTNPAQGGVLTPTLTVTYAG